MNMDRLFFSNFNENLFSAWVYSTNFSYRYKSVADCSIYFNLYLNWLYLVSFIRVLTFDIRVYLLITFVNGDIFSCYFVFMVCIAIKSKEPANWSRVHK